MDIRIATSLYEKWLASRTAVVRGDLQLKHERMRQSPFVFLRATYYRWSNVCPALCRKVCDGPRVLSVGDLHVENFGTWRDREGRLVWGVNDIDEAAVLPYAGDLIRLATSAVLAERDGALTMPMRRVCDAIVEGYTASLDRGGRPIVLAERRRWLREIATSELRDPTRYWREFGKLPTASGAVQLRVLRAAMPGGARDVRICRRAAGAGSLGRPRFVAIGEWAGGFVAREAKAFLGSETAAVRLISATTRASDPYLSIVDGWIVRRLAPDCSRIEMADLPRRRDEGRLLRAMGFEAASIHSSSDAARGVRRDLASRGARWLERPVETMVESTIEDWKDWRRKG
jgi:Uncharacterized protein conserved in bacteria (DUF2252)